MPALFTSPAMVPSFASMVSNRRTTSGSLATSAWDGDRSPAQGPHLGDHRASSGFVRAEVHAHVVAALRRQTRGRRADPTARTGDDHDGHRVSRFWRRAGVIAL